MTKHHVTSSAHLYPDMNPDCLFLVLMLVVRGKQKNGFRVALCPCSPPQLHLDAAFLNISPVNAQVLILHLLGLSFPLVSLWLWWQSVLRGDGERMVWSTAEGGWGWPDAQQVERKGYRVRQVAVAEGGTRISRLCCTAPTQAHPPPTRSHCWHQLNPLGNFVHHHCKQL